MSKKSSKKKVVTSIKKAPLKSKSKIAPTTSRAKTVVNRPSEPLLFGKENYTLMIAGVVLMAIGFILMLGGSMPDPSVWDDDIIYSFSRTVAAPFLILAGLVTLIFAIFKKTARVDTNQ